MPEPLEELRRAWRSLEIPPEAPSEPRDPSDACSAGLDALGLVEHVPPADPQACSAHHCSLR